MWGSEALVKIAKKQRFDDEVRSERSKPHHNKKNNKKHVEKRYDPAKTVR